MGDVPSKNNKPSPGAGVCGEFLLNVGTIGLSKCGGRKPSTLIQAARHNRRTIQAELGAHSHIDVERICLNETIAGPDTPEAVAALALELMTNAGVIKPRKDYAQAIELLCSLAPDTTINIGDYFRRCVAWAGERFGVSNVLSADIHLDESAPHCHVLILPLVDGRMKGSDLIATLELTKLRKSFALDVAQEFGLKAPPRQMSGAMRGQAVRMVLERLESTQDAILKSALWQTVRRGIERNPAPFVAALGIDLTGVEPERKKRTMAQIFTSPGKGGKVDKAAKPIGFAGREASNPKGFADRPELAQVQTLDIAMPNPIGFVNDTETTHQNHRTLSCVGFAQKTTHSVAANPARNEGGENATTGATPALLAATQPGNSSTQQNSTTVTCDTRSDVGNAFDVSATDDDGEDF